MTNQLDISRLWELFEPDFGAGAITQKFKPGGSWHANEYAGKVVGHATRGGYLVLVVDGKKLLVHRIVYAMFHGVWPEYVDHVNGVTSDNRISNLRPATRRQNVANTKVSKRNKSGFKGVFLMKDRNKFRATIGHGDTYELLGFFDSAEEANAVYVKRSIEIHGEFALAARIEEC